MRTPDVDGLYPGLVVSLSATDGVRIELLGLCLNGKQVSNHACGKPSYEQKNLQVHLRLVCCEVFVHISQLVQTASDRDKSSAQHDCLNYLWQVGEHHGRESR